MKHLQISIATFLLLLAAVRAGRAAPGSLNLSFEENRGQATDDARFLARGQGYSIALTRDGNRLSMHHNGRSLFVATRLAGAKSNPKIRGEQKQPGKVHYLWRAHSVTNIPTYAQVRYESIYAGIDLIYYGNQSGLEYDFRIKRGGDPQSIALTFDGADDIRLDAEGNLVLSTGGSEILQHKPVIYQTIRGIRREVDGQFRILSANTVGFAIGPYDSEAILVIDPVLSYFTFLGGSNGNDDGRAIVADTAANVYVTGATASTNFQVVNPIQPNAGSQNPEDELSDAFVSKLNAAGTVLIFSTYLGGTDDDDANAIALDSSEM